MQVTKLQHFHNGGPCRLETSRLNYSTRTSVMKELRRSSYSESLFLHAVKQNQLFLFFFFFYQGFFSRTSWFTGEEGKGEAISLTPLYHFHPLHRHLGVSQVIAAEISPLRIAGSRTQTGKLWFPIGSRWALSYAPFKICPFYTCTDS